MNFEKIKEVLVSSAKDAGLSEYEIYYMEDESLSAETLKDEISGFSKSLCGGVSFRCVVGGKMGYASSELFEEDEMRELVKRAIANAKSMDEDDGSKIFEGSESYAELKIPTFNMPSAAEVKEKALALQKKTYSCDEAVTDGTQSAAIAGKTNIELINSYGLHLKNSVGISGMYAQAVVNKNGESSDGFEFSEGLSSKSAEAAAERAVAEAISKLGAKQIDSGKYDIIISAKEMHSMLGTFCSAFSGKKAFFGMSLLADKVGERIAADCITIVDDPMPEGSTMQTAFDGEGVATYRKNVVDKGVLKTLLYDLATAQKAGVKSTGNGQRASYSSAVSVAPYNFYIESGKSTLDELMGKVERGIYITELKGLHAGADAVTGDFSIESAGFLIENGKRSDAVKSFTVAGNFFELLKNIEDISDKVDFSFSPTFTRIGAPDVLVRGVSVAGK